MIPREYLGAFKAGHRASSRPFIDEELAKRLLRKVIDENCEESKAHLEYITKFNNEYYKAVVKKGDENALHYTDALRKDCYNRDNQRRRDVFCCVELVYLNDGMEKL